MPKPTKKAEEKQEEKEIEQTRREKIEATIEKIKTKVGEKDPAVVALVAEELLELKQYSNEYETVIAQTVEDSQKKEEDLLRKNTELKEENDEIIKTNSSIVSKYDKVMNEVIGEQRKNGTTTSIKGGSTNARDLAEIQENPVGAYSSAFLEGKK